MEELIKLFLTEHGMRKDANIKGFCIGIELIKVKTSYKNCSNLITICISNARLSEGADDWYITNIHNLGGK